MRDTAFGAANKPGLVPLTLAALPALAAVTTGMSGLVAGAGVLVTMAGASLLLSGVWRYIRQNQRGFSYILFAATVASMAQMIASAALPGVSASLGLYLPLTSFSCALTSYWEAFDEDHELEDSLVRAIRNGAVYLLTLTAVGCIREALGAGAVFGASLGEMFSPMRMLAAAPGGFILAGVILAIVRACMPRRAKGGEGA
jgi:electron transport complex protein RnfE